MASTFTTEQALPFTFKVVDGRGRVKPIEGEPKAASSDETVATVSIAAGDANVWNGLISSVSPSPPDTTQRVTVTADADLGEGVMEVVGFLDFTVTLDPRSGARIVEIVAGDPIELTPIKG